MIVIAKDKNGKEREFNISSAGHDETWLKEHFKTSVAGYEFVSIKPDVTTTETPSSTGGTGTIGA